MTPPLLALYDPTLPREAKPADRGDINNPATPLRHHVRRDQFAAHIDRFKVDFQHSAPIFKRIFKNCAAAEDASVVDQDVNAAPLAGYFLLQRHGRRRNWSRQA